MVLIPLEKQDRAKGSSCQKISMKTMRTTAKALMGAGNHARRRRKPRFDNPSAPLFPEATNQGLIQWPTEKQISDVSKQLAKISRMGIRSEANGDYFYSGDLAYQMHEIILATAQLFERGQRLRRKSNGKEVKPRIARITAN